MDKGARFRKCDFQVHSLRDANWSGPFDPIKDRPVFAEKLVAACRSRGIDAIAITDHHDLCMWRAIHTAALAEKLPDGSPVSRDAQLVVFPGTELTLAVPPCQVILLLDPDLSDKTLSHVWGALGVVPTDESAAKTTQTVALGVNKTLEAITDALGQIRTNPEETNPAKFRFLKGRFILLPNVKPGGHQTLMRPGNHGMFASMPFVGGYIEGCLYSDLYDGDRKILEGRVSAWGSKALGIFQTSDCREVKKIDSETFEFVNLGNWPTWVKWAIPSAEALRQACLARMSRISQTEPVLPLLRIEGVRVSDSEFLRQVDLRLNPQFNAFIGGRGTGKSSLLEYIRWALCDDPLEVDEAAELPNFQKRRKALVDATLRPLKARVTVLYRKNEVTYQLERRISDKGDLILVTDPNGISQPMSADQVRREFPVVSYAQKQLSCVGTLPEEINRLITDPVKERVTQIQDRIARTILPEVRQQRQREVRVTFLNTQLIELSTSIKTKREQVLALQGQLHALTPEQQEVIQAHEPLGQKRQLLLRATELPQRATELLEQAKSQVSALGKITVEDPATGAEIQKVAEDVNAFLGKVLEGLNTLIRDGTSGAWLGEVQRRTVEELEENFRKHQIEYDKCVTDSAKSKKQLDEIQNLNKQICALEEKRATIEAERNTLRAVFEEIGSTHWESFVAALKERADLLREQCATVSAQAQHEFKASLAFCGDDRPIRTAVERLVQGRNVKDSDQKVKALAHQVACSEHPVEKWSEVMKQLDSLLASKGSTSLPEAPEFRGAGFTDSNLESIRNGVNVELLEQIRFMNIDDQIEFAFRMGKKQDGTDNYIPFDAASPGQQATCLLRTLLAQSGAPLLIDQPEEDLDNEQIHVLSERIVETKHNRQLLFVSHNANIVVNGDAELVVCFGYGDGGDNTRGIIDPVGSIDCEGIRETVTRVMEGGRQAFEMRKNKYGF